MKDQNDDAESRLEAAREKAAEVARANLALRMGLDGGGRPGSLLGKIWNAPNTAVGVGLGLTGHVLGTLMGRKPRIAFDHNAIEFIDNPMGGFSAMTLGNAILYGRSRPESPDVNGLPTWVGEREHTFQGETLGPAYLPLHVLGGLYSLARDRDETGKPFWHGEHNWLEVGPHSDHPSPWPDRGR